MYNPLIEYGIDSSDMIKDPNSSRYVTDTQSNITRKGCHESALMTAAHILVCLTKEGKSHEEIAREDFDNNLDMVSVWINYMTAINWIYKNTNDSNKWIATDNGKNWVKKIVQYNKER
jgi:hypothetical protein